MRKLVASVVAVAGLSMASPAAAATEVARDQIKISCMTYTFIAYSDRSWALSDDGVTTFRPANMRRFVATVSAVCRSLGS